MRLTAPLLMGGDTDTKRALQPGDQPALAAGLRGDISVMVLSTGAAALLRLRVGVVSF